MIKTKAAMAKPPTNTVDVAATARSGPDRTPDENDIEQGASEFRNDRAAEGDGAFPPSNGRPSAERAARVMASSEAPDRARMTRTLQRTVGNVRAGDLLGRALAGGPGRTTTKGTGAAADTLEGARIGEAARNNATPGEAIEDLPELPPLTTSPTKPAGSATTVQPTRPPLSTPDAPAPESAAFEATAREPASPAASEVKTVSAVAPPSEVAGAEGTTDDRADRVPSSLEQKGIAKKTKPATEPVFTPPELPKSGPEKNEAKVGSEEAAAEETQDAPDSNEAIAPTIRSVRHRAARARKKPRPISRPVDSAQAAARHPKTEQTRRAAEKTVVNLDAAKEETREVKREQFKDKLRKAIERETKKPTSESEAKRVMKTGGKNASQALRGELTRERDASVGPLKNTDKLEVNPADQPAPPKRDLQREQAGPRPARVSTEPLVPAPLPPKRLDYSSDRAPTDELMAENDVTQEQLGQGNEPAFGPALEARATAEDHEATVEARYRESESGVQDTARTKGRTSLAKGLTDIHDARALRIGQVVEQQVGTQGKDASKRQRITDQITAIKNKTKEDLDRILLEMESGATILFEAGLKVAEMAYSAAFEEAKGGALTWLTTWGSDWERHIEKSLATARDRYFLHVDNAIDNVADFVERKLRQARRCVAKGRKDVQDLAEGLDDSVKKFGDDALEAVIAEFDAMDTTVDQRQDDLINRLTQQYKASYERMSAMEEKLREANKSLWQRVYDATVGLVKKIIAFKDMLLDVIGRAAGVMGEIIRHPIRFLGNLVSAVMQGLNRFVDRLDAHLQKGLIEWLFGALGGSGLQLPANLDFQGIISIILQILGLTYANFRARAVAIVGERVVATMERTAEVFKVLAIEGIGGLWRFMKEKLVDLKTMVVDEIFAYIKESVIKAGIAWIIGLLNPASAFFKACKAIYDIVMFFINRGSQILALVNAVIDSIGAIAKGSIGAAATFVENALAKAIPVAIGFLASLLSLGDPSQPVRELIERAREPVNKAIDWVINLAVKGVKAAGGFVRGVVGGKKETSQDDGGDVDHSTSTAAVPGGRPIVEVPFSMSGEEHKIIYAPQEDGGVELLMASRRSLPLRKEFAASHTALDNVRRYVASIEEPAVKELFREEFGSVLDDLPADLVKRFTDVYDEYFPRGKGDELSPKDRMRARQKVQMLVRDAESLTKRIQSWGDKYEIDGLKTDDVDEAIREKGNRLWSSAWQDTRRRIQGLIDKYGYHGAPVQMRGSVEKGFRGDPKARTRFDERDFDVDMFVVQRDAFDEAESDGARITFGMIFPQPTVPDLVALSNQVRDDLVSAFPHVTRIGESDVVLRRSPPKG